MAPIDAERRRPPAVEPTVNRPASPGGLSCGGDKGIEFGTGIEDVRQVSRQTAGRRAGDGIDHGEGVVRGHS